MIDQLIIKIENSSDYLTTTEQEIIIDALVYYKEVYI